MVKRWTLAMAAGLAITACATGSFEGTPIAEWAGAYGNTETIFPKEVPNDITGLGRLLYARTSENVLEIRPEGPRRARIDFMKFYPRGHQCSIAGTVDLIGDRLVFRETNESGLCQFSIRREVNNSSGEDELTLRQDRDVSNSCTIYCGANAQLYASIPVSTRHALPATPVTEVEQE